MSQANVFNLLKKKKRWMTVIEVSETLKVRDASDSLRRLYKHREILRKGIRKHNITYQYKIK